jgi:radical SAM superfamily enzyme YgiQ (UPF0313 family)
VAFFDDALLWNAGEHIKPLLTELVRRALPLRFHTPNGLHARFVDAEVADLMRRAGFKTIRISLETVCADRTVLWDNKVRYEEFLAAATHFREAGFTPDELGAYVMVAVPGETLDEAARNIAAAHAAGTKVKIAQYSPIPGSAFFAEAKRASRFDLDEPLCHNGTVFPAGGLGSYGAYAKLKDFARSLNDELERGRIAFSPVEVESAGTDFAAFVSQ